jgi:hypothetical protein
MHRVALAAALVPAWLSLAAPAQACEQYGPRPVALTGMLTSLQASGPPGYGANPRTDSVEQVPLLQLDPPLCVDGGAGGPAVASLDTVQVVAPPSAPPFAPSLFGTKVVVSGTLMPAAGPQHRTQVVIQAREVRPLLSTTAP